MKWLAPLLWLLLGGCRTAPLNLADGAVARDAGCDSGGLSSPPTDGVVSCAQRPCNIAVSEPCCVDPQPPFNQSCGPGGCPPNQQSLFCDGPEDCSTGICCMPIQNSVGAAHCARDCLGGITLCHRAADCAGGMICAAQSGLPHGVGSCSVSTCP